MLEEVGRRRTGPVADERAGGGRPNVRAYAPVLWRWYRLPLSFEAWPKVARLRDTVTARTAFGQIGLVA